MPALETWVISSPKVRFTYFLSAQLWQRELSNAKLILIRSNLRPQRHSLRKQIHWKKCKASPRFPSLLHVSVCEHFSFRTHERRVKKFVHEKHFKLADKTAKVGLRAGWKQSKTFPPNENKTFRGKKLSPKHCTKAIFIFVPISFLSIDWTVKWCMKELELKNWIVEGERRHLWVEINLLLVALTRKCNLLTGVGSPAARPGERKRQKATIPTKLSTKRKLNYWKMSFCHRNDAKVGKIWFSAPPRTVSASAYYSLLFSPCGGD